MADNSRQSRHSDPQKRAWILTIPFRDMSLSDVQGAIDALRCSRAVWQLEAGGESGYQHIQAYLEFGRGVRLTTLQRAFPGVHAEARRGTVKQCYDYCTKENTRVAGPFTIGNWDDLGGGQGSRTDLKRLHRAILDNEDLDDVWVDEEYGPLMLKYHSGAGKLFAAKQRVRARDQPRGKPTIVVLWGPTGTGKSARAHHKYPNAYKLAQPATSGQPIWWDGYYAQKEVIFDDFRGRVCMSTLFNWLDRYECRVEARGISTTLRANVFIFTSNIPPEDWYSGAPECDREPLMRRLQNIIHVTDLEQDIPGFPMPCLDSDAAESAAELE